jgi:hypothetical protein
MRPANNAKETSHCEETDEGFFCDSLDSIENWTFHGHYSFFVSVYGDVPEYMKIRKEAPESIENWTLYETDSEEDDGNEEDPELIQEERTSKHKLASKQNAMASILVK